MASYSHWNWICPYFRWDKKDDLHCEAGVLKFKDGEHKRGYAALYCCNLLAWEKCSLAAALSHFYEKGNEDEQEPGREPEETDQGTAPEE